MFLLEAQTVKKWLGGRLLFALDELKVQAGEKIGIVGLNGAGKTTLLRTLAGEEPVDDGRIVRRGSVAWIKQLVSRSDAPISGGGTGAGADQAGVFPASVDFVGG
ncbi:ATP-binding cassette domain-containing protein [Laceyella putida]|uniref:ATP-binding cassette domain-containing protein n=1 Tax=Laceyella putida TaxID=110101 RepID=A0ABW2RJH4_9BACL